MLLERVTSKIVETRITPNKNLLMQRSANPRNEDLLLNKKECVRFYGGDDKQKSQTKIPIWASARKLKKRGKTWLQKWYEFKRNEKTLKWATRSEVEDDYATVANRLSSILTSEFAVKKFSFNKAEWTAWIAHYEHRV